MDRGIVTLKIMGLDVGLVEEKLTKKVIGSCFDVHNELGFGFLEKCYENALVIALEEKELHVVSQCPLKVTFRKRVVGDFYADVIVENKVLIEIKAVGKLKKRTRSADSTLSESDRYPRRIAREFCKTKS